MAVKFPSGMWKHTIGATLRTRSIALPKEAVLERVNNIDTVLSIAFITLSLRRGSLEVRASPSRMVVMDSAEGEFWSCTASGCSGNVIPVICW